MIAHRLTATSLLFTGDVVRGRAHYDEAIALYEYVAEQWPEHEAYATECVKAINGKRAAD